MEERMNDHIYGDYDYEGHEEFGSDLNNNEGKRNGKKKGKKLLIGSIAAAMAVAVSAGAIGYAAHASSRSGSEAAQLSLAGQEKAAPDFYTAEEESISRLQLANEQETAGKVVYRDFTEVVKDAMPSIVSVYNTYVEQYRDWFGQAHEQEGTATGSGIIIAKTDDEILVVTNNHVVDGEESMEVKFIDDVSVPALIKGTDEENDLAVIAVKLEDVDEDTLNKIKVATIGDSEELQIGEPVIAIGNALGYGQSVTAGIVSAVDRKIGTDEEDALTYVQTDAAINPGNSGGALVNANGEVIGINSNKIGGTAIEGMCYAIPTSRAIPIISDLMNQSTKEKVDEADQGYLGIKGVSVTDDVANAYDLPKGAYVAEIIEGGGAADSELKKGDVITAVNKQSVSGIEALQRQLQYYKSGDEVTLTVKRSAGDGEYKELEVKVKLGDKSTLGEDDADTEEKTEENSEDKNEGNDRDGRDSRNGEEYGPQEGFGIFPWNWNFGY